MIKIDAEQFWLRYKKLAEKDLPVTLSADIAQSTLSTWRKRKIFPRADQAYLIAKSIDTTVEYLVTGQNKTNKSYPELAQDILEIADKMSEEGLKILVCIASPLVSLFSKMP